MDKHTPGPWNASLEAFDNDGMQETVIEAIRGQASVAVALDFGPENIEWRPANAKLIAAAPDLLDACRKIVAAFDALAPSSAARAAPMGINAARAAIAKAVGAG